jgi:putative cell wall-binding protein
MFKKSKDTKSEEKKADFGLKTLSLEMRKDSAGYLKEVQDELVQEEKDSLKDFVKGAYRVVVEKEQQIQTLQAEVVKFKKAIEEATSGDWEALGLLKIPTRFFEESTLRKHGKSLLDGTSELRIMELYTPTKDED